MEIQKKDCQFIPLTLSEANQFVEAFHRHCDPVPYHLFSIGLVYQKEIIGVLIVGRPVARVLDNGCNAEIRRCCVLSGFKNANSMLYARAKRICQLLGYQKIYTYTLLEESGSSLKAIKAEKEELIYGDQWDTPARRRAFAKVYRKRKIRWQLNDNESLITFSKKELLEESNH